jgi:pyruvate dehydrogenase E2 component (dihydrolipoamide acetyltransferase)
MRYFKLPDLGEGLTEADIVEWYVKAGDEVKEDQIIVAVETAKAIVDVPSPQSGIIENVFGQPGDTLHIGEPLVEYQGENDSVSVVGNLFAQPLQKGEGNKAQQDIVISENFKIGCDQDSSLRAVQASPSIRALARRLGVDLQMISGSGSGGRITAEDVEKNANLNQLHGASEKLTGPRKAMAKAMQKSASEVVPVTLFGDADISHWMQENKAINFTIRIAQAIAAASLQEPAMNAWFDGENLTRRLLDFVDLGIAVDSSHGLFVPVLRNVTQRTEEDLANGLNKLKDDVNKRTIPPAEMAGATIILSNYGSLASDRDESGQSIRAARYGTPVVIPPMVAIVGIGNGYKSPEVINEQIDIRDMLPISISFDHRAVTGAEATRFMAALIAEIQQK